ncbi:hypothetical protein CYY_001405 [Polysphondylium violaceum]|uniref:CENP-V/GFA domain-containing protein n=1 Tax=Polysphondylium violaceum TaxID=133409 RepID=A0A8J4V1N1_9MYCE|nr:hypothetical protein CYY_001405 [Polysphondylium violaceum]
MDRKGSCACGKVKVTCEISNEECGVCHCGTCVKWSAGPFISIKGVKNVNFVEGEQYVKLFDSSFWAQRGFCSECGTSLFYQLKQSKEYIMSLFLFDDMVKPQLISQVYIDKKPSCYEFSNQTSINLTEAQIIAMFAPKNFKFNQSFYLNMSTSSNQESNLHPVAKGYHDKDTTDSYKKGRPTIPLETVTFIKDTFNLDPNVKALDLAAGTGKFTELIAKGGFKDISAIEPSPQFRDACVEVLENIKSSMSPDLVYQVEDGLSTSIPRGDESVDVLFISQAFHWFDSVESIVEISRVLKKGGVLAMVWADMDNSVPLTKALTDIFHEKYYDGKAPQYRSGKWKKVFEDLKSNPKPNTIDPELKLKTFYFNHHLNKEMMIDRAMSTSYIAMKTKEEKEQISKELAEVMDKDPRSSDGKYFDLKYDVCLYYTTKQ